MSREHVGGESPRVVLMENLQERGHVLRDRLVQARCDVGVLEDARSLLRWLVEGLVPGEGTTPDLLICNARMLGEAGLGLLARWREANPQVPVLLLSAFTSPKLRARLARLPGCLLFDQCFAIEDVCSAALAQVGAYVTS